MASGSTKDGIQIVVRPTLAQVRKKIAIRMKRLAKFNHPHKKIAIFLDRWVQKNFKSEGGKVGGWAPLKAGGRWAKGKGLDTTAKILQDTGRLRVSFLPFANMKNAGVGSDIPYSRKHEKGEEGLPVRRMLPKNREVMKDVRKIYDKHVKESIK